MKEMRGSSLSLFSSLRPARRIRLCNEIPDSSLLVTCPPSTLLLLRLRPPSVRGSREGGDPPRRHVSPHVQNASPSSLRTPLRTRIRCLFVVAFLRSCLRSAASAACRGYCEKNIHLGRLNPETTKSILRVRCQGFEPPHCHKVVSTVSMATPRELDCVHVVCDCVYKTNPCARDLP
jgi:hypothetical protein